MLNQDPNQWIQEFALTYSIVARDEKTGQLGVAVQSHWFSVGTVVTWARAGVGAVATQSMAEITYGPLGLELMASGKTAREALSALLKSDLRNEVRQVAMVDSRGGASVHTGSKCIPYAGHVEGNQFTCQANLMRNDTIWGSMERAFRENPNLELPERLVSALEAAEKAGGDVRGKQSAAILVVSSEVAANSWSGRLVDLRVEDHPQPIPELKRLLRLRRGYDWANRGDEFLSEGRMEESYRAYERAGELAPEIEELRYWQAVSLVNSKKLREARPIFKEVFAKNKDWIAVTKTLPRAGLLPDDPDLLNLIIS